MTKKTRITHIDCTPTFLWATNVCLMSLEGGTLEGKKLAREELRRFAIELDRLKEVLNKPKSTKQ